MISDGYTLDAAVSLRVEAGNASHIGNRLQCPLVQTEFKAVRLEAGHVELASLRRITKWGNAC
jgi:hypothetical protein